MLMIFLMLHYISCSLVTHEDIENYQEHLHHITQAITLTDPDRI